MRDTKDIIKSMNEQNQFVIKDSGQRLTFDSGMVRDTTEGKIDYTLALDGPMFKRFAIHLTNGAKKYSKRNWLKANGLEELERFRESAFRHFLQWYWGEDEEDHAAAAWYNINAAEYTKEQIKLNNSKVTDSKCLACGMQHSDALIKRCPVFPCNDSGNKEKDGS